MMYLVLFVILIIVYLCYLFQWWRTQTAFPKKCTVIDKLDSSQVRAGDLIFTTTKKNRWRYSWWKHVAIVFEDKDGRKKVADFLRNGLHIVPIEMYARDTVYGVRSIQRSLTDVQKNDLRLAIHSHTMTTFNHYYVALFILRQILPSLIVDQWIVGEHCTSFVADCLQNCDVMRHSDRYKMSVMNFTTDKALDMYYGSDPLKLYVAK